MDRRMKLDKGLYIAPHLVPIVAPVVVEVLTQRIEQLESANGHLAARLSEYQAAEPDDEPISLAGT